MVEPLPKVLPPGTRLYRVIGENQVNGFLWIYELPDSLESWRATSAVQGLWNRNGYYVEYTVGQRGLPVWEGQAASQTYEKQGFKDWLQPGGGIQVFVPTAKSDIPKTLARKATNWEKSNG